MKKNILTQLRIVKNFKLSLISMLTILMISSCKTDLGTDAGNPLKPTPVDSGESEPPVDCNGNSRCALPPIAGQMTAFFTDKILTCYYDKNQFSDETQYNEKKSQIFNDIYKQTGLEKIYNYSEQQIYFQSFNELESLLRTKKITISYLKMNTCLKSIDELSCADSIWKNIYNITDEYNYSNIHQLFNINEDCLNMIEVKDIIN